MENRKPLDEIFGGAVRPAGIRKPLSEIVDREPVVKEQAPNLPLSMDRQPLQWKAGLLKPQPASALQNIAPMEIKESTNLRQTRSKPRSLDDSVRDWWNRTIGGNTLQTIQKQSTSLSEEDLQQQEAKEAEFRSVVDKEIGRNELVKNPFTFSKDGTVKIGDKDYAGEEATYLRDNYIADMRHEKSFLQDENYRNDWLLKHTGLSEKAYRNKIADHLETKLTKIESRLPDLSFQNTRGGYAAVGGAMQSGSKEGQSWIPSADALAKAHKTIDMLRKDNFGAGLKEGLDVGDVITLGFKSAGDNKLLNNALESASKGGKLSESQQALIDVWKYTQETENAIAMLGGRSTTAGIGRGITGSLPFIPEMIASGGIASAATKGIVAATAKSALRSAATNGASKIAAGLQKGVYKLAESAVGAAARVPFTGMVYGNYQDKRSAQFSIRPDMDEEGRNKISKTYSPVLKDTLFACLEAWTEFHSEDAGMMIDAGIRRFGAGLAASSFGKRAGLNKLSGFKRSAALDWIGRNAKIAGFAGEALGEAYGDAVVNLFEGNRDGWRQMASKQYWWELGGVTAALSGSFKVMNAPSALSYSKQISALNGVKKSALASIEDQSLKTQLLKAASYDKLSDRSTALANINWRDKSISKQSAVHGIDFINAQTKIDVLQGAQGETERLRRALPMMDFIGEIGYKGVDGKQQAEEVIQAVTQDGDVCFVLSGEVKGQGEVEILDADGNKQNIATTSIANLSRKDLSDAIAYAYAAAFKTQANQEQLDRIRTRVKDATEAGVDPHSINEIIQNAGFTLYKQGDEVTTVDGKMGIVSEVLGGAYEVINDAGLTATYGFNDILQPDPEMAQAQSKAVDAEAPEARAKRQLTEQAEQAISKARNQDDDLIYTAIIDGEPVHIIKGEGLRYNSETKRIETDDPHSTVVVQYADGSKTLVTTSMIDSVEEIVSTDQARSVAQKTIQNELLAQAIESKEMITLTDGTNGWLDSVNEDGSYLFAYEDPEGKTAVRHIASEDVVGLTETKSEQIAPQDDVTIETETDSSQDNTTAPQSDFSDKKDATTIPNKQEPTEEIPSLKNGSVDYNTMSAEMLAVELSRVVGHDKAVERLQISRNANIKSINKLQRSLDQMGDLNKAMATDRRLTALQTEGVRLTVALEQLGVVAENSQKSQSIATDKNFSEEIDRLFPNGMPNLQTQVLADIARGQRFVWGDSADGTKRGVAKELGFTGNESERRARFGILGGERTGAKYVSSYIHNLWESNNGYAFDLDDAEMRNEVLEALSQVYSRASAMKRLRDIASRNTEDPNAVRDAEDAAAKQAYDEEQMVLKPQEDTAQPVQVEDDSVPFQITKEGTPKGIDAERYGVIIDQLKRAVGAENVTTDPAEMHRVYEQLFKLTPENADETILDLGLSTAEMPHVDKKKTLNLLGAPSPLAGASIDQEFVTATNIVTNFENPKITPENIEDGRYMRTPNGEVYGFTVGGKIYLDGSKMNAETPIHEYVELWAQIVAKEQPELWRKGVELMKQTKIWQVVNKDPNYKDLSEDLRASETLARINAAEFAHQQEQITDTATLLGRLRPWMRKFWDVLKETFSQWTTEEIHKLSSKEFMDLSMRDFLDGVDLKKYNSIRASEVRLQKQVNTERVEIETRAKANGTWLKAPNGEPTNLNEKQWVEVRTKEFKNWFGDWEKAARIEKLSQIEKNKLPSFTELMAHQPNESRNVGILDTDIKDKRLLSISQINTSKVVDANGEPQVMYHGSPDKFTIFSSAKMGGTGTSQGQGFYFTPNKDMALGYQKEDGALFETYLNIRKPMSLERKTITKVQYKKFMDALDRYISKHDEDGIDLLSNYNDVKTYGRSRVLNDAVELEYSYCDTDVELVGSLVNASGDFHAVETVLKSQLGYDGVITSNGLEYVVTNPVDIKSATENIGAFDPSNPDIRFSRDFIEREITPLEKMEQEQADLLADRENNPNFEDQIRDVEDRIAEYERVDHVAATFIDPDGDAHLQAVKDVVYDVQRLHNIGNVQVTISRNAETLLKYAHENRWAKEDISKIKAGKLSPGYYGDDNIILVASEIDTKARSIRVFWHERTHGVTEAIISTEQIEAAARQATVGVLDRALSERGYTSDCCSLEQQGDEYVSRAIDILSWKGLLAEYLSDHGSNIQPIISYLSERNVPAFLTDIIIKDCEFIKNQKYDNTTEPVIRNNNDRRTSKWGENRVATDQGADTPRGGVADTGDKTLHGNLSSTARDSRRGVDRRARTDRSDRATVGTSGAVESDRIPIKSSGRVEEERSAVARRGYSSAKGDPESHGDTAGVQRVGEIGLQQHLEDLLPKKSKRQKLIEDLRLEIKNNRLQTKTIARIIGKRVRDSFGKELVEVMNKRYFDAIVRHIEQANARQDLDKPLRRIAEIVYDLEIKQKEDVVKKLLDLRVQGESPRGVSVAKTVDDKTRVLFETIRNNLHRPAAEVRAELDESESSDMYAYFGVSILERYQEAENIKKEILDITADIRTERNQHAEFWHMRTAANKASNTVESEKLTKEITKNDELIAALENEQIHKKELLSGKLAEVSGEMNRVLSNGVEILQEWCAAQVEHKKAIATMAFRDIGDGKQIPVLDRQEGAWRKSFDRVKDLLLAPAYSYNYLLKMISVNAPKGEGVLYNHFMRSEHGFVAARGDFYLGFQDFKKQLDDKSQEIFGKSYLKVLADSNESTSAIMTITDGRIKEMYSPTIGESIYVYMANKMTDGVVKLRKMGIDQENVDALLKKLPEKYIEFADWLQDEFLPAMRLKYNQTHLDVFGTQMAEVDNYVPLKVQKSSIYKEVDGVKENAADLPSAITGSIIRRRRNTLAINLHTNALDLMLEHGQQMEHWNAFTRIVQDSNTLLSNTHLRRMLENRNKGLHKRLKVAAQIAAGAYISETNSTNKTWTALGKMAASSKIALRLFTAMKQVLSYPAFYAYSSSPEYWKKVTRNAFPTTWGRNFKWSAENIPSFRERWLSRTAGNEKLSQMTAPALDKWVASMGKYGMLPNAFVDALACANGAKSVYDFKLSEYLKGGKMMPEAIRLACIDAAIAINETQQSSEGAFLSQLQSDRDFWSVSFSTFQNSNFAYLRKQLEGIDELFRDVNRERRYRQHQFENEGLPEAEAYNRAIKEVAKAKREAVLNIMIFAYMLNIMWVLGGNLLKYMFDDEGRDSIASDAVMPLMLAPIRNTSIGSITESFANGYDANPSVLLSDLLGFTGRLRRVMNTDKSNEWNESVAYLTARMIVSNGTGVDMNSIVNIYYGIAGIIRDGANVEDVMGILNAPLSQAKLIAGKPKEGETEQAYQERMIFAERRIRANTDGATLGRWAMNYEAYRCAELLGYSVERSKNGCVTIPAIKELDDAYLETIHKIGFDRSGDLLSTADFSGEPAQYVAKIKKLRGDIWSIYRLDRDVKKMVIFNEARRDKMLEIQQLKQECIDLWNENKSEE